MKELPMQRQHKHVSDCHSGKVWLYAAFADAQLSMVQPEHSKKPCTCKCSATEKGSDPLTHRVSLSVCTAALSCDGRSSPGHGCLTCIAVDLLTTSSIPISGSLLAVIRQTQIELRQNHCCGCSLPAPVPEEGCCCRCRQCNTGSHCTDTSCCPGWCDGPAAACAMSARAAGTEAISAHRERIQQLQRNGLLSQWSPTTQLGQMGSAQAIGAGNHETPDGRLTRMKASSGTLPAQR